MTDFPNPNPNPNPQPWYWACAVPENTVREPGVIRRRRTVPAQQPRQWRDVQLIPISTNPPIFYLVDERRFVEVYTDPTTGEQMTRDADPLALQALVNRQLQAAQGRALQQQTQVSPSASTPRRRTRDDALASTSRASRPVASQGRVPDSTQHAARTHPPSPILPDAVVDARQFAQAMGASASASTSSTTANRTNATSGRHP
ncbi:hypothetical protein AAVH_26876 [Aphelenchoides avenae]|nr:hypothetical protein AAVH_26876 [Aphelenchus avenae]